ncbi:MAG: flagellar biosynthetic protein FliO [Bacteriovoracaceae bacterium]|jgi:flagellar biogenesis protein FliO|nr:flagellar biosynthetic protein FliO [Bacteriovoracaceae bacterium]
MKLSLLLLTFIFSSAFASVKVSDLNFSKKSNKGILRVKYTGQMDAYPQFSVIKDTILLKIQDAALKKKIDKYERFATEYKDTRLRAYYSNKNEIKVKAVFPFNMQKYKDLVSLTIRDNHIELTFPKLSVSKAVLSKLEKKSPKTKNIIDKKNVKKSGVAAKSVLNEQYLSSLMAKHNATVSPAKMKKDMVKTTLAANKKVSNKPKKTAKSSFSFAAYAGKFVAFLAVIIALFYGVVTVMKKGFIKKGKLGFLNNTDQVTVLSQTHIAPKKSLMLIRAHNQVFLVSNTDAGIHPISEIKDVSGLIKDGEKIIAGNNFDDTLTSSEGGNVKLKEDISKSNKESSLSDFLGVKDKIKFSDQLKKKVKGLKPLQ